MRASTIAAALVAGLAASPAVACARPPSETDAQIAQRVERYVLRTYRAATSLVEVEVLKDSTFRAAGTVRVMRVYKGDAKVGGLHRMPGDTDSCGAGNMNAGSSGLMLIGGLKPQVYPGLLSEMGVRILRSHGLAVRPLR